MREPIVLLVADPRPAVRGALRASLGLEEGIRVAGAVGDMVAAQWVAAAARITLAIVDSGQAGCGRSSRSIGCGRSRVVVKGMGDPALYADCYAVAGASGLAMVVARDGATRHRCAPASIQGSERRRR